MMPVNSKSTVAMVLQYMDKLDKDEVDTTKAIAMSKLAQTVVNFLLYEGKRAQWMSDPKIKAEHRNIELKEFDCLP